MFLPVTVSSQCASLSILACSSSLLAHSLLLPAWPWPSPTNTNLSNRHFTFARMTADDRRRRYQLDNYIRTIWTQWSSNFAVIWSSHKSFFSPDLHITVTHWYLAGSTRWHFAVISPYLLPAAVREGVKKNLFSENTHSFICTANIQ